MTAHPHGGYKQTDTIMVTFTTYEFTFSKKPGEDCFELFTRIVDEVVATIPHKVHSIDKVLYIVGICSRMARELYDGEADTITDRIYIND